MKKALSILGSTGSIGVSTLEVVRQFQDRFQVVALAGGRNISLLRQQIEAFQPILAAVLNRELAEELKLFCIDHRRKIYNIIYIVTMK